LKIHARLWVVEQTSDCDGTPRYSLCKSPLHKMNIKTEHILYSLYKNSPHKMDIQTEHILYQKDMILKNDISVKIIYNVVGGFVEKDLTVIEVTQDIKNGIKSLSWE